MVLTEKQEEGLKMAIQRYHQGEPFTCIAGYAGTGKSTLIKFIISALHLSEDEVAYVAYTGKAATVLQEKGCKNAVTAHKLLYTTTPLPDGTYIHKPRTRLEGDFKVIVVDEVSMLPKELWELLLSFDVHVIACGDPFQLPPVKGDEDNKILEHPHIFLTEIVRQAEDNEIIKLSMLIREGKPIPYFKGKNVQVIKKSELVSGMFTWADQILCATNKTRNEINSLVRGYQNKPEYPVEGDKVICLKNHWEKFSNKGSPLTNGVIGTLKNPRKADLYLPKYICPEGRVDLLRSTIDISEDGSEYFFDLDMDYKSILSGEKQLDSRQEYLLSKNKRYASEPPYEMAYGYAITVWKAQGSEWNKVLLFEENFPFNQEEHLKYMYTGVTRASDKIVVVRG